MKIALVGYGKMGRIIDTVATERGHEIVARLNATPSRESLADAEVVIEFSKPDAAFENSKQCLELGLPVICGTTGWLEKKTEIENIARQNNAAFLYGSNFSLGVNLFFELSAQLAKLMNSFPDYQVQLEEIHHTEKKDAPSGTAITIAERIIEQDERFNGWKLDRTLDNALGIFAIRQDEVPGTHSVRYRSEVDEIEIKHTAFSRNGFATGAVIAAEWIRGRKGIFSVKDVLFDR